MSQTNDDGGAAFAAPSVFDDSGLLELGQVGMSLRDYFAAKAMQALIAKLPMLDLHGVCGAEPTEKQVAELRPTVAASAYAYADAMLAERQKAKP